MSLTFGRVPTSKQDGEKRDMQPFIISKLSTCISVRGGGAGGAAAPPVGKKIVLFGQRHSKKYFII